MHAFQCAFFVRIEYVKPMAKFDLESNLNNTSDKLKNLFTFLGDFKNFSSILPEDKVENFQYQENQCSFSIKGITPMTIKMQDKKPVEYILFTSQGLAKFDFALTVNFIGSAEETGQCKIKLSGDLNPFILSMAEKSLKNLLDTMSTKLSELNTLSK